MQVIAYNFNSTLAAVPQHKKIQFNLILIKQQILEHQIPRGNARLQSFAETIYIHACTFIHTHAHIYYIDYNIFHKNQYRTTHKIFVQQK